jgi:X-Pro dipeptidyl-peptidase
LPVRMSGSPSVTLRVKVDRPTTELTAKLVDYGNQRRVDYQSPGEGITTLKTQSCWGQSTTVDDACYFDTQQDFVTTDVDVITRGWLDAAHHVTLSRQTPLTPGRWYTITVPIDTTDAVVRAGHRLGVVVTQSDNENTTPTPTGATVTIDPRGSRLNAPLTLYGTTYPKGLPAATRSQFPHTVTPHTTVQPRRTSRQVP